MLFAIKIIVLHLFKYYHSLLIMQFENNLINEDFNKPITGPRDFYNPT